MGKLTAIVMMAGIGVCLFAVPAHAGYLASDVVGQNVSGVDDYTSSAANNGSISPIASGFTSPVSVTVDTTGHRLFVSEAGQNRVLVFNLDSNNEPVDDTADYVLGQPDFQTNTSSTSQSGLFGPVGVAVDSTHERLFVADGSNNRVLVYDISGGITNGMDASYVLGQANFTTSPGVNDQKHARSPRGIAYDAASDRLFVTTDNTQHRVLIFDFNVFPLATYASAAYVLGQPDFTTVSTGTTAAKMNRPYGVAYSPSTQRLFVCEVSNNRVTVFDLSSGITNGASASYVLGQSDFTTASAGTTQDHLNVPTICDLNDTLGLLYVPQFTGNRVSVFDVNSITNGENASAVLGQDDFTSSTAATTQDGLKAANGVAVDSANNRLWVADYSNNRVIRYDFVTLPSTTLSDATTGTSYTGSLSPQNSQGTVSYSLVSGSLPTGISASSMSGTPTESGTFSFTLQATDDNGSIGSFLSNQRSYNLTAASIANAVPLGPWLNPQPNPTPPASDLHEGDTISSPDSNDPDIYIINDWGYKRLFLNPIIFSFYGHLGGFANVTNVTPTVRDSYTTSGLFRNCETNDQKVYGVEVTGEDTGILHWINVTGTQAVAQDPDFFHKVFCINSNEFNWYSQGDPYTSLTQVSVYRR